MATIVIHAGMPKTGSTSIQRWIVGNCARLRQQHGVQVLAVRRVTPGEPGDGVRLEPYESGDVSSNWLLWTWLAAEQPPEIPRRFFDELETLSDRYPTVLITAEGLSHAFALDESFIEGFESLTSDHDVRVAYYVRPQHTAIEAGWRQAGYKHRELTPSEWVRRQTKRLRYVNALEAFDEIAPHVTLRMRPFVPDLLDGSSPVEDFARRFLGLDEEYGEVHANPGLPLELVNVMRHSPEGWFWTWTENVDAETFPREKFARLLDGLEIPESSGIRRSRLVLQQHCHDVFEPGNREVIRRNGWPLDEFVPSVGLDGDWDVAELDTLWEPEASESEQALIHHALREALLRT